MADLACAQGADHSTDEADGDSESLVLRAEAVESHEGVDGAGYDNSIEAEEQASERTGQGRLDQVRIGSHRRQSCDSDSSYRLTAACGKPGAGRSEGGVSCVQDCKEVVPTAKDMAMLFACGTPRHRGICVSM